MPHGGINDLLNAVNIGCKGCNDDSPLRFGKHFFKGFAEFFFGRRNSRKFSIGAVHQKRENALCAVTRKAVDIDRLVVDGSVVNLEVARMNDDADGGRDRKSDRTRNGVTDLYKFDFEASDFNNVARIDAFKTCILNMVFVQLVFNQRKGEFGSENGYFKFFQCIGYCADMILVPVCDDECAKAFGILLKVTHIGNDHVDSGHFFVGKRKPAVDNDNVLVVFKYSHVFSDFAQSAERNDFQLGCCGFSCQIFLLSVHGKAGCRNNRPSKHHAKGSQK